VLKNAATAANTQDVVFAKAKSEETFLTIKRAEGIWARFMAIELTAEEDRLAKTKLELHAAYVESVTRIFQMAIAGDFESAMKNVREDAEPLFSGLHGIIYSMITLQGDVAAKIC